MVHWNLSPHPVADVRDWSNAGRLELQPDFQRREVWTLAAKIMLIDSILSDIPLPKIFLAKKIQNASVYRVVIDGQQRISAILGFLRDEFRLETPYRGPHLNKFFSELDPAIQDQFLRYRIDFNEADNPSDRETRDVYMRVNKYTTPLTRQELRRADYPGAFLQLSEQLSVDEFFESSRIFNAADRRRYADAEYISELLAGIIDGPQDKKTGLDSFYIKFAEWKPIERKQVEARFRAALVDINSIFSAVPPGLSGTRFRQKADFYSLFLAVDELRCGSLSISGKDLKPLSEDLIMLEEGIAPESEVDIFRDYAIKCVSQANSLASRRWRQAFIKSILAGTYSSSAPTGGAIHIYYKILDDCASGGGFCPDPVYECPSCNVEFTVDEKEHVLAWPPGTSAYQIGNARWIHKACAATLASWTQIERTTGHARNESDLF